MKFKFNNLRNERCAYRRCNPVWESVNRKFTLFNSGIIVQFRWQIRDVHSIVCQQEVACGVLQAQVRDDPGNNITEFFFGVNSCRELLYLSVI